MAVMLDNWWCLPTGSKVRARAKRDGVSADVALARMLEEREALIRRSREDPYRFVTEPGIWLVCDALMDFPWCSDLTRAYLLERLSRMPHIVAEYGPLTWDNVWGVFKRAMRKCLGARRPVRHLLIPGTNRSSKSNYCVSRAVRFACEYDWKSAGEDDVRAYFMHESHKRVVEDQMSLIFKYLPQELREKAMKTDDAYVAYRPATGFSNDMFMTPNGIKAFFRSYEQDAEKALEGFTAKLVVAEENVPLKWADRVFTRLSDKNGWYLQPFTPIHGWTATVGVFQAGMRVVRTIPAYVLPEDMGQPLIHSAVGLTEREFSHVEECKWGDPPRQAVCPRSRPEDCVGWLCENEVRGERKEVRSGEGEGGRRDCGLANGDLKLGNGEGEGHAEARRRGDGRRDCGLANGDLRLGKGDGERRFERVPRVALCVDERKAVVWFSPMDNPYSDAADVIRNNLPKGRDEVLKCVYGVAVKSFSAKFARFSRDVHVVPAAAVPAAGLNGFVCDPAGTRNWAMAWYRLCGDAIYFYREFPSPARVTPGVGVMGLWAEPDDRNGGANDGRKGPGQEPLGWSYLRYKAEIARLEGWKDWKEWLERAEAEPGEFWNGTALVPPDAEVEAWDEDNGSDERTDKIGDVRALSTPKQEKDRFETMQTILDECGLRLDFADGVDVEDGVSVINHMLDFERRADGTFMRAPKLYVSEECVNLILALENWQNTDGLRGAYKDFVDLVRYACLRAKKAEFMRRGLTVISARGGRAAAPGVGRRKDEGGRRKDEVGAGFVKVMGAGGRCVVRMRRR
jgi:hypothetical protein